jgi:pyruvate dehydrogenase E2 component (dihydrolipoamide acetyltransferase)
MYGVDRFQAIINPGQAAILSVGAMTRRPVEGPESRTRWADVLTLGLICDHRILYGADAAEFLAHIRRLVEQPLTMAL